MSERFQCQKAGNAFLAVDVLIEPKKHSKTQEISVVPFLISGSKPEESIQNLMKKHQKSDFCATVGANKHRVLASFPFVRSIDLGIWICAPGAPRTSICAQRVAKIHFARNQHCGDFGGRICVFF